MKMVILAAGLGTRMHAVTGGRSKSLVDLGGETVLDRLLVLAGEIGLDPLIVTRPDYVADFQDVPAEVLVEERPVGILTTLYQTRDILEALREPFVWVGGDLVFTEHEPLRELVRNHDPECFASYLICRTDRFKAKVRFEPELEFAITRKGEWPFSSPAVGVQSPRVFSFMEPDPEADFVSPALAAGETVTFREYLPRIFELDTPLDLAEARDYFSRCPSIS